MLRTTFVNRRNRLLCTLAVLASFSQVATGQTLLFEDDFEDGVIDPALWEVWLPFSNSSVQETGGVMRIENRGWLLSAPTLTGLDQDLIIEGEIWHSIPSGYAADYWRTWIYANNSPEGPPHNENTDGLCGHWAGEDPACDVYGMGNIQTSGAHGDGVGGNWKGFRLSTRNGVVTWEVWDLSNPVDLVEVQAAFSKSPGAGERIIFYNRSHVVYDHVALLDNVKVYLADTCHTANYCIANPNTTGQAGMIGASGVPSVSQNQFNLRAAHLPPNDFGMFFFSTQPRTPWAHGEGYLCVAAAGMERLLPPLKSNAAGAVVRHFDLSSVPGPPIQAGDTRYFQYWYRDHPAVGYEWNFTDALEVTFCP